MANGGKVLEPRLVGRVEPQDPASGEAPTIFPSGLVRDELDVHPRNLKILQDAMLAETEDPEGTGRGAVVPGLRVCGKTGTAQVKNEQGQPTGWHYWFASFAPYENPRYAVVVMVQSENRGSGDHRLRADCARHLRGDFEKRKAGHPGPGRVASPGAGKLK